LRNNLLGDGAGCKGVFKLVSPATGEAFAVKLVERHRSSEAAAKHSFEKEVTIFYKLRHPGICRLRTVVSDARYHMLVVELCEQGELFSEVARGALSEATARDYFVQIVEAADYCHSMRIYHRDLKLENVLVKDEATKRIKVSDFGMARDCGVNSSPATKGMGTVSYMAPEVAAAGPGAYDGAAVDVWSMGVMLYVMVVCNYPFGHDGVGGVPVREIIRRSSRAEFRFPAHATLSADIQDLITGMLTVDVQR
jgi:serine/threonine protein kinase